MNKTLLLLSCAATLGAASCNQNKEAAVDAATTPSADTAVVVRDNATDIAATGSDTAAYLTEADRIADRIAQDLRLTDTVVVTRVQKTYYTRGRRIQQANTQYATDTTGRYAALRSINDETDRSVKTIVTDPAQYNTYTSNRDAYYAGTPYTPSTTETTTTTTRASTPARRRGPAIVKYERDGGDVKIEYANGTKVKIDKDGERKTKFASGRKVKVDDDGERKVKN
ncbi:hypothetical protein HMJ29_05415 [Hymenobacter taeanensis]|uniref:Centromere protein J C-terminal domain-containing protein n=1 Tax=Hymenobacter taeanensis TaxID=2735321 RepID=A0A6M6BGM7_9BACT|nr:MULTISPECIES: T-complex 10 C-terminal domain-containing protein [Hymenobacter]QJX46403.1 hypothetical protein HMJ29_05415 [Hymenobacter taeanensis]UOQ80264.1 T-complex 10 C-terminal domain-containing protein [Hymenobacter sp. 5414T-23]